MMTSRQRYLVISAAVFAVVAVAHLTRAIEAWPITIGTWSVPVEASWLGAIAAGALSLWSILLLRDRDD
jgi:hypothetical protein